MGDVSNEHASFPVALPSLDHLTNDELASLKGKFASSAKEARRKANQTIGRFPQLKKPWQRSLSVSKSVPPEERAAILAEFERELLRVPEAYIAHAFANSLILLEVGCRDEMIRRSITPPVKSKPEAAAPHAPESEETPLEEAFRQV